MSNKLNQMLAIVSMQHERALGKEQLAIDLGRYGIAAEARARANNYAAQYADLVAVRDEYEKELERLRKELAYQTQLAEAGSQLADAVRKDILDPYGMRGRSSAYIR